MKKMNESKFWLAVFWGGWLLTHFLVIAIIILFCAGVLGLALTLFGNFIAPMGGTQI
jgi:hypothetical protein